jgi:hypothetical protein
MFGLSVVFLLKCIRNDHCFKVIRKSINSFVFFGKKFFLYKNRSFIIIIKEHSVRQQMKHGLVSYLYLNLNPRFHDGNKPVIYHHYLMIECVTMHLIYFSFVEIFSLYYLIIFFLIFIENARLRSGTTYIGQTMSQSSLFQTIRSTKYTCTGACRCTCCQRGSQVILNDCVCLCTHVSYLLTVTSDIFCSFS